ncbi:helix-turn-helix domain containing protein [Nocardia sp. NBC_00565]|uniref:helix-turn-helix domain-containing protein n=1 Tax=Nocardia sp. NBC_00565 TaxID=2975993 RepID=UPI002E81B075|nr:helix-turn-helix domain-containing protein [Nocardia sp. NBC_00565]WUC07820.1 helix-turn-helix domain containing protein [Nocardia sp. NBC_00565]
MRRAVVVMASAQHQPVGLIAKLMQVSESYVRQVIHDFNEKGFDALDPKWTPLANSVGAVVVRHDRHRGFGRGVDGGCGVVASAQVRRGSGGNGPSRAGGVPGRMLGDAGAGCSGAGLL